MTRDELISRLKSNEWSDIEFKEAAWSVPKYARTTVTEVGVKLNVLHEQLADPSEEGNGY